MNDYDIRSFISPVTADTSEDGQPRIFGMAPVFDQRSEVLVERGRKFVEVIRSTAVEKVLSGADVRGRFDHQSILARTKNGTLKLNVQSDGVRYEMLINKDDTEAMDAYAKVKRGDVDGSSFMFRVAAGGEEWKKEGDLAVRYINEFSELLDVGPVTFPAYPQASAQARSMFDEFQKSSDPAESPATEAGGEAVDPQEQVEMLRRRLTLLE
jgi:uncharacterized protein